MKFTENDLITIAKRDNNNKRPFLLVDPLQGKHLPVSPAKSLELFKELANQVFENTDTDVSSTLIIGFAETATAIGAGLAYYAPFDAAYIQTTRESFPGKEFLYFSEEHSHATDQMVIKEFLDAKLQQHSHIIFAEDEVTTGKTIENFIRVLKKTYPDYTFTFSIASILNGMTEEKLTSLKEQGISVNYLLKVPSYDYPEILSKYSYDPELTKVCKAGTMEVPKYYFNEYDNTRTGVLFCEYRVLCENFAKKVMMELSLDKVEEKRILILGTEEFMFPGIFLGNYLEQNSTNWCFFHATTRSPILPSLSHNYPIRHRYCLTSFYEQERGTYVYNLEAYDYVLIVTDTTVETSAMSELCGILEEKGCKNIMEILWR